MTEWDSNTLSASCIKIFFIYWSSPRQENTNIATIKST